MSTLECFTELPAPNGPNRPPLDVFGNPLLCGFGVFTRNHRQHLDEAVVLCTRDPERRVTFRSAKKWVSAAAAVEFGVTVPVYMAAVGGAASAYGHSSGAGLALNAAASGLPITRLVLHEPPYGPDDEEGKRDARELAENVRAALAEDRRAEAINLFFTASGMPPEMVEGMSCDPKMQALAPTMLYDFEVMGDFSRGGTIPENLVGAISIPTLVIAGGASPDFFRDTAARITEALPNGKYTVLEGQDHGAPANVVAPVVAEFFTTRSPEAR